MPSESIFAAVFLPTPKKPVHGQRRKKTLLPPQGSTIVKPSGFWLSQAILATSLLGPTPTVKKCPLTFNFRFYFLGVVLGLLEAALNLLSHIQISFVDADLLKAVA